MTESEIKARLYDLIMRASEATDRLVRVNGMMILSDDLEEYRRLQQELDNVRERERQRQIIGSVPSENFLYQNNEQQPLKEVVSAKTASDPVVELTPLTTLDSSLPKENNTQTELPKPRFREVNETDEQYEAYLKDFYEKAYPTKKETTVQQSATAILPQLAESVHSDDEHIIGVLPEQAESVHELGAQEEPKSQIERIGNSVFIHPNDPNYPTVEMNAQEYDQGIDVNEPVQATTSQEAETAPEKNDEVDDYFSLPPESKQTTEAAIPEPILASKLSRGESEIVEAWDMSAINNTPLHTKAWNFVKNNAKRLLASAGLIAVTAGAMTGFASTLPNSNENQAQAGTEITSPTSYTTQVAMDTTTFTQPENTPTVEDLKIGDSAASLNLTQGYQSAQDAISNTNATNLNQNYVGSNQGTYVTGFAVPNDQTGTTNVTTTPGTTLEQVAEQHNVDPSEVAIRFGVGDQAQDQQGYANTNQYEAKTR